MSTSSVSSSSSSGSAPVLPPVIDDPSAASSGSAQAATGASAQDLDNAYVATGESGGNKTGAAKGKSSEEAVPTQISETTYNQSAKVAKLEQAGVATLTGNVLSIEESIRGDGPTGAASLFSSAAYTNPLSTPAQMSPGETVSNLNGMADTLSKPSVLLGTAGIIGLGTRIGARAEQAVAGGNASSTSSSSQGATTSTATSTSGGVTTTTTTTTSTGDGGTTASTTTSGTEESSDTTSTATAATLPAPYEMDLAKIMSDIQELTEVQGELLSSQQAAQLDATSMAAELSVDGADALRQGANMMMTMAFVGLGMGVGGSAVSVGMTGYGTKQAAMATGGPTTQNLASATDKAVGSATAYQKAQGKAAKSQSLLDADPGNQQLQQQVKDDNQAVVDTKKEADADLQALDNMLTDYGNRGVVLDKSVRENAENTLASLQGLEPPNETAAAGPQAAAPGQQQQGEIIPAVPPPPAEPALPPQVGQSFPPQVGPAAQPAQPAAAGQQGPKTVDPNLDAQKMQTIQDYGNNAVKANKAFQTSTGLAEAHGNAFQQRNALSQAMAGLMKSGGGIAESSGQAESKKAEAEKMEATAAADVQSQTKTDMSSGISQTLDMVKQLRDSSKNVAGVMSQIVSDTRPA